MFFSHYYVQIRPKSTATAIYQVSRFFLITLAITTGIAATVDLAMPTAQAGTLHENKCLARAGYATSLSTNLDYLQREAVFDKEKFPQRNMSRVTDDEIFIVDDEYTKQVEMKDKLYKLNPQKILQSTTRLAAAEELHHAEQETLDLIVRQLTKQYPGQFTLEQDTIIDSVRGKRWKIKDLKGSPLEVAGQLVQEDMVLVKTLPDGQHHIVGGYLGFPTKWSLGSTLDESMSQIHAESGPDKKSTEMLNKTINMILAKLKAGEPIRRNNWIVIADSTLALPDYRSKSFKTRTVTPDQVADHLYIRSERQTLSRLPETGYLLFTVKVHTYSAATVAKTPGVADRVLRGLEFQKTSAPAAFTEEHQMLADFLINWHL